MPNSTFMVGQVRIAASLSSGCRPRLPVGAASGHGGIEPDRQQAAAPERCVIGWQVPGLVGGGCGSAHALRLPHWFHEMNPSPDLCSRASQHRCSLGRAVQEGSIPGSGQSGEGMVTGV
jgi:hypothetical protein